MPSRPSGRLTKKIALHSVPNRSPLTSAPPTIGPNTAARPMTGPQMPNALGSSSVEKTSLITPRPWGIISAPKAPCTRRNAISIPGELASPHAIEAAVKPAAPIRKRRRRPKMSPSRPPVTRPTLNASA